MLESREDGVVRRTEVISLDHGLVVKEPIGTD